MYQVYTFKKGGEFANNSGLQTSSSPSFAPYSCEAEFKKEKSNLDFPAGY